MAPIWTFLSSQPVRHAYMGAIGGFLVAIRADRESFATWKCWNDVLTFDWRVASFRYVKGAAIGAVSVSALGGFGG